MTPLGIPNPKVLSVSGVVGKEGVIIGKKKVCFKMLFRKNEAF